MRVQRTARAFHAVLGVSDLFGVLHRLVTDGITSGQTAADVGGAKSDWAPIASTRRPLSTPFHRLRCVAQRVNIPYSGSLLTAPTSGFGCIHVDFFESLTAEQTIQDQRPHHLRDARPVTAVMTPGSSRPRVARSGMSCPSRVGLFRTWSGFSSPGTRPSEKQSLIIDHQDVSCRPESQTTPPAQ